MKISCYIVTKIINVLSKQRSKGYSTPHLTLAHSQPLAKIKDILHWFDKYGAL